jgi:hypothetical protein
MRIAVCQTFKRTGVRGNETATSNNNNKYTVEKRICGDERKEEQTQEEIDFLRKSSKNIRVEHGERDRNIRILGKPS